MCLSNEFMELANDKYIQEAWSIYGQKLFYKRVKLQQLSISGFENCTEVDDTTNIKFTFIDNILTTPSIKCLLMNMEI